MSANSPHAPLRSVLLSFTAVTRSLACKLLVKQPDDVICHKDITAAHFESALCDISVQNSTPLPREPQTPFIFRKTIFSRGSSACVFVAKRKRRRRHGPSRFPMFGTFLKISAGKRVRLDGKNVLRFSAGTDSLFFCVRILSPKAPNRFMQRLRRRALLPAENYFRSGDRMNAYRLLHVEDEPDIREVVEMSLALDPGILLKSCATGADALAAAADWDPDVILMDVMMPVMDGPQTLGHLREDARTAKIPVVFMTARAQSREVQHFLALGAAGVIPKPFDPMTLAAAVRAYLPA